MDSELEALSKKYTDREIAFNSIEWILETLKFICQAYEVLLLSIPLNGFLDHLVGVAGS